MMVGIAEEHLLREMLVDEWGIRFGLFDELVLIGLRDADGETRGEDMVLAAETMDELRGLFRRALRVTLRRFPGEPGTGLFPAEADGPD